MSDAQPQDEPTMEEILSSIRQIISEDGAKGGATADAVEPETAADDADDDADIDGTILELTQVVDDDDSVLELGMDAMVVSETEPEPKSVLEPEPIVVPTTPRAARSLEGLVSDEVGAQATASLSSLHTTVVATKGAPLGHPGHTVEDVVKELLRPMLKQWLDNNLHGLVERIVSREISKLIVKAEDEKG